MTECVTVEGAEFSLLTIPKVCATSMRTVLLEHFGHDPTICTQVHMHPALIREVRDPVFSMVRHPLDRLVSCWEDRLRGPRPSAQFGDAPSDSFADFVVWVATQGTGWDTHLRSQCSHMRGIDRLTVVRFEDLPQSWVTIQAATGLPALPRLNASKRRPWRAYYDDDTAALARQLYRDDLNRWCYA